MECVRSRAGDKVDNTAGSTSSFRSVVVGLDRDLLNTFNVRLDSDGADHTFVVVDSVDHPVVEGIVLSVDGQAGGVGAAIVGAATAAESVAGPLVGAGDQVHKLDKVTAVQRKVLHCFRGHGRAYCGAVGLQERRACDDFDCGGLGTGLEVDVGAGAVAGFD